MTLKPFLGLGLEGVTSGVGFRQGGACEDVGMNRGGALWPERKGIRNVWGRTRQDRELLGMCLPGVCLLGDDGWMVACWGLDVETRFKGQGGQDGGHQGGLRRGWLGVFCRWVKQQVSGVVPGGLGTGGAVW